MAGCTLEKAYGEQLFNKGSGLSGIGDYTIINCTFADNWTLQGSTIHKYNDSKIILINSILWNGGNEISSNNNSNLTITYCNIQGGWEGEGNIDVDPLFANPGYWADVNDPNIIAEANDPNAVWVDGDYHLKSQAGRYDPNSGDWVIDDVTSPCIDTGDPNTPVGEEPEPNGGIVNMGAYGGTIQASKSLSTTGIITR